MYSTEIVLDTATIRGKLKLKLTEILRPEKHRITHHHSAKLQITYPGPRGFLLILSFFIYAPVN